MAANQHGVVARRQLAALGLTPSAIKHLVSAGRLHPLARGVYAIGRAKLPRHGLWMAAVLGCGPHALLSHESAAALWGIAPHGAGPIHVSVPAARRHSRRGVVVHRRAALRRSDITRHDSISVTTPICTLIDLSTCLHRNRLEAAVNEADKLDLVDPETLRSSLDSFRGRRGVRTLRELLDRRTFCLTDSQLERMFVPLARQARLSKPETGVYVHGFKVDFYWPALGLIIETDGLRYHRTPAQQEKDRLRDQVHTAAGLTTLRFTHPQIKFEPERVQATLRAVAARLG